MDKPHVLGIDIGGTNTRLSVFCKDHGLSSTIWEMCVATKQYYSDLLNFLEDMRNNLENFNICGIGISIGIQLSADGRTIIASNKLPDYVGHNLHKDIECIFETELKIAHDCVCAVIAEYFKLEKSENIAYITISSGTGGAILLNSENEIIAFRTRLAHHIIDRKGKVCHCGQIGCLASLTDGKELERKYKGPLESLNDISFWKDFTNSVSIGLVNISWLFPITKIIIGGGIALNQPYVRNNLKKAFRSNRSTGNNCGCEILFSQFGEKAPIVGACLLMNRKVKILY